MTTWLVDGMNVIGSRPDGWWRDRRGAQARLARELAAWAAATGVRVEVVFDGAPHEISGADAVDVAFASRGAQWWRRASYGRGWCGRGEPLLEPRQPGHPQNRLNRPNTRAGS